MSINQRFKEFIKSKSLKQSEIGEKLGITRQAVSLITTKRSNLTVEHISNLIRIYPELNIIWLLTGEGDPIIDNVVNEALEKYGHQHCVSDDIHQQCLDQIKEKDVQIKSLLKIIEGKN